MYTIELDIKLADRAVSYLADRENVTVLHGDALDVLPKVLQSPVDKVLIFLDGHFSGGVTVCGDMPEPAVEELRVISAYRDKIQAVVVDDFRCFGTEHGWPSKSALLKAAEDYFEKYGFELNAHLDQLILERKA
ncbi:MAG: hypothetical protein ACREXS_04705 [Gammaproteobacteria bacterium]